MARAAAFLIVIFLLVAGVFAMRTGGGRSQPTGRAQLGYEAVPAGRGQFIVRPTTVALGAEAGMVNFLRQAVVREAQYAADQGQYTRDLTRLRLERPANVQATILRIADDGMRITALSEKLGRQCDIFAGDSARWAFGYAFDPRVPRCGPIR